MPDLLGLVRAERTIRWETFDIGSATFVRSTSDCASGFGVDLATDRFRIGPAAALAGFCEKPPPPLLMVRIRKIERAGERAWIVADAERVLGCVQLQEAPRRAPAALVRRLRVSGLKLMLVSTRRGTEARRLAEALGTDDFLSRAGPETKLALVARHRGAGRTIVVGGAGDAEARALEEASVGVLAAPRMPAPVGSADVLQLHGGSRHLLELARVGVEFQVVRGVVFGLALGTLLAQALVAIPAALAPLFPESPLLAALGFASAPRALAAAALYHPISFLLYFGLARIGLGRNDPRPDRRWRVNLFRYALAGALLTVAGTRLLDVFLAHIPIP